MSLTSINKHSACLLLAIVLFCLLSACSADNSAKAPEERMGDIETSGHQQSGTEPAEAAETWTDTAAKSTAETEATEEADAAKAEKSNETGTTANDKLIGSNSEYSFYLSADNSVYSTDTTGKRTDCTMLSGYSGWATYFTFNSDLYIFGDYSQARKACAIPSGDLFLGSMDFHVYYISADYSKAYSINESGDRHESAILLYGGNYYFALDSTIYTVMPNGAGLKQLYSEHSVEVGPHNEHILELSKIENGIIYFTDESTGDVLDCQYDMAEGKAYYIDPATGKVDPR